MLGPLLRMMLLHRFFGPRAGHGRSGYGRHGAGRHGGRRKSGFGLFGPLPYYSRQTRHGGRVSVGGCCLPIPLALALLLAGGARRLTPRRPSP